MKCFRMLIEEENCDPNIEDNYGETLTNMAIKNFKLVTLKIILRSGKLRINQENAWGVTPIGQAIISRNVEVIQDLLDAGANVHT